MRSEDAVPMQTPGSSVWLVVVRSIVAGMLVAQRIWHVVWLMVKGAA
jgi:hypothetical protein